MIQQRIETAPKGVLIYGIGQVGQTVARLVAHRGWPVIAVNRAGEKIGRDLGELTGAPALAGRRVADVAETDLAALDADIAVVAVHDRLAMTIDHHRRLLEAGLNVICVGAESAYPSDVDRRLASEIHDIAFANGVTFTGCGLWDTYRIGTLKTIAGPCTEITALHHRSVTDANRFGAEVMRLVHVGDDPAEIGGGAEAAPERSIYRVFLAQAVASLGLMVERVEERQEPVVLDQPVDCPALDRTIAPGLCTGMRTIIRMICANGTVALAEIDLRLTAPGEVERISWRIEGSPPVEMKLEGLDTGHATASSVVNRISDVLEASPGLVTADRLPPMQFPGNYTA